jgi:hypothetical protein
MTFDAPGNRHRHCDILVVQCETKNFECGSTSKPPSAVSRKQMQKRFRIASGSRQPSRDRGIYFTQMIYGTHGLRASADHGLKCDRNLRVWDMTLRSDSF